MPRKSMYIKRRKAPKRSNRLAIYKNPDIRESQLVRLNYNQIISLNASTGSIGAGGSNKWSFSFNSLFDPDVTGTGAQPLFFDQYSLVYSRYNVHYAKCTATVINHAVNTAVWNGSAVTTQPNHSYRLLMVRDNDETDVPTDLNTLMMQKSSSVKWRYVAPQLNGKLPSLSMSCVPHKVAGVSKGDDTMLASVVGSPARNIKCSLIVASADGFTDPPSVYVNVNIEYYVRFTDRIHSLPPS